MDGSRLTVDCIVPLLEVVKKCIQLCVSMSSTFSSGRSSTVPQQTQVILCRILELPLNFSTANQIKRVSNLSPIVFS